MKKLFSDSVVSKLRVLPSFVWVIFVIISFFFARAYEFLLTGEYYAAVMEEAYKELGYNINPVTAGVMFSIVEAIFYTVIFEILLAIVFNLVVGRFRCQINRSDFKFRLRYFIVIVNLIIGIISIGYFFTQYENGVINPNISLFSGKINILNAENPYYSIQSAVLPFAVSAIFAIFFFEDFRNRYVPPRNQPTLFIRFAMIFVGINVILFVYRIFQNFLFINNPSPATVTEIVAYSLEAFSYVAASVIYYFYYRKLKKELDNIHFDIPSSDDKNKNENIFDDFGF